MTNRVRRSGSTVRRPLAFWSPAVHDLLRHLQAVGFPASRLLGTEAGQEILSWIDGESGPYGWAKIVPEAGLRRWARFLRRYHQAVAGYRPASGSIWSSGPGTCAAGEVICHGDFGPWNGVWRGDDIVGLIERCAALGRQGIEPQATWIRDGYLDTVRARIRWTEVLRL